MLRSLGQSIRGAFLPVDDSMTTIGMRKRMPRTIFALLLAMSLSCFACGGEYASGGKTRKPIEEMTPEEARAKLKERGRDYGEYPFLFAMRDGDTIAVKLYLKAGMNPDTVDTKRILHRGSRGTHVLMHTLRVGRTEMAMALIEAGANIKIRDRNGTTPLMYAALRAEPQLVKALLKAGADPNARVGRNMTVLIYGVLGGRGEVKDAFLNLWTDAAAGLSAEVQGGSRRGGNSPSQGAFQGPPEIVETLIKAGADPNAQTVHGETALMYAARAGLVEKVKVLLENGANPSLKNMTGDTALTLAGKAKHTDVVQLLKRAVAAK